MKKINCKIRVPDSYTENDITKMLLEINDNFARKTDNPWIEKSDPPINLELDYVSNWLSDMDDDTLQFKWRLDDDQTDQFHRFFSKKLLLQVIRQMIDHLQTK